MKTVVLLLLAGLTSSQYICGNFTSASAFAVGDKVPICLHFSVINQKVLFMPNLDVYSAIEVKGAFSNFTNTFYQNNSIWSSGNQTNQTNAFAIQVAAQAGGTNITSWIPYIANSLVAPVLSVVVTVSNGQLSSVTWDNGCDLCSDQCATAAGNSTEQVCAQTFCPPANTTDCDPRLYVSFLGKDSNGLYLQSGGYRISQFRQYSLYQTYTEAKQNF